MQVPTRIMLYFYFSLGSTALHTTDTPTRPLTRLMPHIQSPCFPFILFVLFRCCWLAVCLNGSCCEEPEKKKERNKTDWGTMAMVRESPVNTWQHRPPFSRNTQRTFHVQEVVYFFSLRVSFYLPRGTSTSFTMLTAPNQQRRIITTIAKTTNHAKHRQELFGIIGVLLVCFFFWPKQGLKWHHGLIEKYDGWSQRVLFCYVPLSRQYHQVQGYDLFSHRKKNNVLCF